MCLTLRFLLVACSRRSCDRIHSCRPYLSHNSPTNTLESAKFSHTPQRHIDSTSTSNEPVQPIQSIKSTSLHRPSTPPACNSAQCRLRFTRRRTPESPNCVPLPRSLARRCRCRVAPPARPPIDGRRRRREDWRRRRRAARHRFRAAVSRRAAGS